MLFFLPFSLLDYLFTPLFVVLVKSIYAEAYHSSIRATSPASLLSLLASNLTNSLTILFIDPLLNYSLIVLLLLIYSTIFSVCQDRLC